jgi:DNA-binding XRE family transcriptional regulator
MTSNTPPANTPPANTPSANTPPAHRDAAADRHWLCATRLRERRRQLGMTQADVARQLAGRGVPLTNRTLSAMENGRGLDLGRLPDLAAALDCTVTYLIGMTADPHRWQPDEPMIAPGPTAPHRNWILGPVPAVPPMPPAPARGPAPAPIAMGQPAPPS